MKKIALIITSAIVLILGLVYTLLFTSLGNNILKPSIENKINAYAPLKLELSEFSLDTNTIRVLIKVDEANTILAEGTYSIFNQTFDINYHVDLGKLSSFNALAQAKLAGKLKTDGNINGHMDLFKIKGQSHLAKSDTQYSIIIKDLALEKAAIKLSDGHIQDFLSMTTQEPYANGRIDLHAQINDLNPEHMKADLALDLTQARLNAKILKKEFGLTLSKTGLDSKLKAKLEGDDLKYIFDLNSELATLSSKGQMKVSQKSIDAAYNIDIKELALLQSITSSSVRGPFSTHGDINGDTHNLLVQGETDIAASKSSYDISLKDLNPSKVLVTIKDASLEKLLYMLGEEKYAQATINADIQLNNLDPKALDGKALIKVSKGKINRKVMRRSFDVNLPKTDFDFGSVVNLKAKNINYTLDLNSNLAKINSKGDFQPESMHTKASYNINIKELALLKPLTGSVLRGPLSTSGGLNGDKKELHLKGKSDLARSRTTYDIMLKEYSPVSALVDIKNAQLSKLLYLLDQPNYAEGDININTKLTSVASLNGKIKMGITKGLVHKTPVKKDFNISMPYTKFELQSESTIKDDKLTANTRIHSNLATLKMKKTSLDIKTLAFKTDYDLFVPFLERLEPILERKLFGEVRADGEIRQDKKLIITAHSKIFQGKINAKIVDEKINADFTDLRAIEILKTLGYPEVMDAPINGTFAYNTKTQKGKLDSKFDQATLTRSKMTDLFKNLTRTDLSKERFNKGSLISLINKEIINSDLQMTSKTMSLKSKKFIINSKKQIIDARFALKIKKYPGDVIIKGNISSPSVKLDAKSVITPEIEKKVGKELDRFLKKLF